MNFEEMAASLEASGDYKVLRRIRPRRFINEPDGSPVRTALFVDVETTGLNAATDEIIELAMVPFSYGSDGEIYEVRDAFQSFQEPVGEISEEITKITGIDQEMVAGQKIDWASVENYVANADVILAHNASFDRKFLERYCSAFQFKPWGCSATQVDWRGEDFEGSRLGYLVATAGYFYDRHRALNDCYAAIELLAKPLPKSGRTALSILLENARAVSWRVWANQAPFDLKEQLKKRGYRWSNGENGAQRAWYIDVSEESRDAEIAFLRDEIYRWEAPVNYQKIDAYDRFSVRS
jgi:DNA polymerase-3 subunit epsilon